MSEKFEKFDFKTATNDLSITTFEEVLNTRTPVIFDTNFLFVTFEFKIDLIENIQRLLGTNYNFFIYEGTIDELLAVEKKGDKNKKFLPLISTMLHIYNFKVIKSDQKYIDDQILENLNEIVLIATNDKELRLKIQAARKRVLFMRQKKYLQIQ